MHICDVRACIRPDHLAAGTLELNNQDRAAKGRNGNHKGASNGQAKLTMRQVDSIKMDYLSGDRQVDIAMRYGVTQTTVSKIVTGRSWE